MKVIVQVPCHNEAHSLGLVLESIPRTMPGVDVVERLVVDDGSTDGTAEEAARAGVEHVIRFPQRRGLAAAFRAGLEECLCRGADVIVNTDGDNQYPQEDIPALIRPILEGRADMVVADRQPLRVGHFSWPKRFLQAVGSWVVRMASGTRVPDAPSGFRAYSREAALRLTVLSPYSYTLETLIQAGAQRMAIAYVPVQVRPDMRPSRLSHGLWQYVKMSAATILRAYTMYQPLKVFFFMGALFLALGTLGVLRFLYYWVTQGGAGHVQSLVLSAAVFIVGFQVLLIGLLADLIAANRRLLEELLYRARRQDADRSGDSPHPPGPTPRAGRHA